MVPAVCTYNSDEVLLERTFATLELDGTQNTNERNGPHTPSVNVESSSTWMFLHASGTVIFGGRLLVNFGMGP